MLSEKSIEDWLYAFLGGMGIGALFILLNLIEANLPRRLTWENMLLFCVMIGMGFAFTALPLVLWEDRKKQMQVSKLTSPGWLIGEWTLVTLWTTAVLSLTLSAASFFYSGDWSVLVMLAVFAPLSAMLSAYFVSRNRALQQENDRWKKT